MGSFPDSGFSRGQHILPIRDVLLIRLRYTASGAHSIACVGLASDESRTVHACGGCQPSAFTNAIWQIGKRYQQGGLERALFDAFRRDKVQAQDQQSQQRIIAVVFSPPEGRVRWMMRLLTEEVIRRKLVSQVGRETIRLLLECHDLKIREQVYRTVVQRSDGIGGLEQRRL